MLIQEVWCAVITPFLAFCIATAPVTIDCETDLNDAEVIALAEIAPEPIEEEIITDLGEYTLTAYCSCEKCCGKWAQTGTILTADGTEAVQGFTVGTDWNTIPPGTTLIIDGHEYEAHDKVAGWITERYNGKIIDVYFESHTDALKFGKKKMTIYRKETK